MTHKRPIERLVGTTAIVALALAGAATARAQGKPENKERSEQTVIRSRSFTIPQGRCSQLPGDLAVDGLGLERTTTIVTDDKDELHGRLVSTITGTATDNAGGSYTFSYNLRADGAIPGSGLLVDTFKLTGRGRANGLSTTIKARVTFDAGFNPVAFEVLQATGDPFSCDPL